MLALKGNDEGTVLDLRNQKPDQGLKQVLQLSQCQQDLCEYVVSGCSMATVTDLLGDFAEATFETEIRLVFFTITLPVVQAVYLQHVQLV